MQAEHNDNPPGHLAGSAILELDNVGRSFSGLQAVQGVSLTLERGERHAVLGPNGAGKTTLFNLITGDLIPDQGRVRLSGVDVSRWPTQQRIQHGLRRTYQQSLLFHSMSVAENLFLALRGVNGHHFHMRPSAADRALREQAAQIAERVHLLEQLDTSISVLSYGQQRQLEIGMALVGEPKLVLFDEPAAGLSPSERGDLVQLIESLPRDLCIGLIEHDLDIALKLADRITIMQDGAVVTCGTPDEISSDPAVQRIYLGAHHDG